ECENTECPRACPGEYEFDEDGCNTCVCKGCDDAQCRCSSDANGCESFCTCNTRCSAADECNPRCTCK
uniref:Theromin n=1 Tax=Theromyzon tessulatum TaxID=13286 RepID=THBI_THETS|nr:RecName: Full=Theromin; AltName: Full=Thrombin inhibitor [Theromyzon tessulatum]